MLHDKSQQIVCLREGRIGAKHEFVLAAVAYISTLEVLCACWAWDCTNRGTYVCMLIHTIVYVSNTPLQISYRVPIVPYKYCFVVVWCGVVACCCVWLLLRVAACWPPLELTMLLYVKYPPMSCDSPYYRYRLRYGCLVRHLPRMTHLYGRLLELPRLIGRWFCWVDQACVLHHLRDDRVCWFYCNVCHHTYTTSRWTAFSWYTFDRCFAAAGKFPDFRVEPSQLTLEQWRIVINCCNTYSTVCISSNHDE